jgi:hypothetical protein
MTEENDTDDQQLSHVPMEPEVLKSKGNEAFQKSKFHDALLCLSVIDIISYPRRSGCSTIL